MKKGIILVLLAMGLGMTAWAEESANSNYVWVEATDDSAPTNTNQATEASSGFVVRPVS